MDERTARLLPRLIRALDTLEVDSEIIQTVRRIREALGPAAFSTAMLTDKVSLAHENQIISLKLRGFGLVLRRVEHADSTIDAALRHISDGLIDGGSVDRLELLLIMAWLREIWGDEEASASFYARSASRMQSQLWDTMNEIWSGADR